MQHGRDTVVQNTDSLLGFIQQGVSSERQGKLLEALKIYQQGLTAFPSSAEIYNNMGNILKQMGQLSEALSAYQKAAGLNPHLAEPFNNIGLILQLQGKGEEALHYFEKSLAVNPAYTLPRLNRALSHLLMGQFDIAWKDYELRQLAPDFPVKDPNKPLWKGEDLTGKTLLVYAEQGFGDTIQFIRYLPIIRYCRAKIILNVQLGLGKLLENCSGFDVLIETSEGMQPPVEFDVQVPIMSLPAILKTNLATIPAEIPYLAPIPELVEKWKPKFCHSDFNIGIVWSGNPNHVLNQYRSCPLSIFAELAKISYAKFYSLQKGPLAASVHKNFRWDELRDLDKEIKNFSDTAAIIANLDLVITVDTAIAHLAGAMGKPVWVALSAVPDWRWMLERSDSLWYPTMRLFRQKKLNDWATVIHEICNSLKYQSKADFNFLLH